MKLRLPSKLQAALIATLASAAFTTLSTGTTAQAWDTTTSQKQKYVSTEESYTRNNWNYNADTGEISAPSGAWDAFTFKLDNNYLSTHSGNEKMLYVTPTKSATKTWGFYATGSSITGLWEGKTWTNGGTKTQTDLAGLADGEGKIILTAKINTGGTYLYSGEGTGGTQVYGTSSLKSTGDGAVIKLTLSKDLVDSFLVNYTETVVDWQDTAGTTKTYEYAYTQTSNRSATLVSDAGYDAYIVSSGAEVWFASRATTLEIAGDLYVGGTYGDGYGALRLGSQSGGTLKMNGTMVLGADTVISTDYEPGSVGTIIMNGNVEGVGHGLSIVTPRGDVDAPISFTGKVDLATFSSASSVTFGSTAVASLGNVTFTTANRTFTNDGAVTVSGGTINSLAGNSMTASFTKTTGGTLNLQGADYMGAVSVEGGTLDLTGSQSVRMGSLTMGEDTTLVLGGYGDNLLNATILTLDGATLDLTNIHYSAQPLVIANVGMYASWEGVQFANYEEGYDLTLNLEERTSDYALTLTYTRQGDEYIWQGTNANNKWTDAVWQRGQSTGLEFDPGKDATFGDTAENKTVSITTTAIARDVKVDAEGYIFSFAPEAESTAALEAQKLVLQGHTLSLVGTGTMSVGSFADSGTVSVDSGATLQADGEIVLYSDNTLVFTGAGALQADSMTNDGGGVTFSLPTSIDSLTVNSGTTTVDAAVQVKRLAGSGSITVNPSKVLTIGDAEHPETASIFSGAFVGSGGIDSVGDLTITGDNSQYSGTITVESGSTVTAGAGTGFHKQLGTGSVVVENGGTLVLQVHGSNDAGAGMPASITGAGAVKVTDNNFQYHSASYLEDFTGTVVIADGGVVQVGNTTNKFAKAALEIAAGGTIKGWGNTFEHDILLTGGTLADAGDNETYSGTISLGADSSVSATNNHTITLSGKVEGEYVLTTAGQGTVKLSGAGSSIGGLNATARSTEVDADMSTGTISGGPVAIAQNATLTVGNGTSFTYSGTFSGAGNLTKVGSGALTLEGDNAGLGGLVTVTAGTLAANTATALGTGSVTVGANGTLQLAGTVQNTVGGDFTLDGTLVFQQSDNLAVAGNFTLGSAATLQLTALESLVRPDTSSISLVSAAGFAMPQDLSGVTLQWTMPAERNASLAVVGNNLVVTLSSVNRDLVWNGGSANWSAENHWHIAGTETNASFTPYDDVTFDGTGGAATVTLTENTNIGKMTLTNAGNTLTIATGGHDLTVTKLVSADATRDNKLTKSGAGTATFNGEDTVYFDVLTIGENAGTTIFNQHVVQTGGTRFSVSSDVAFHDGYQYTGTNNYGLLVGGASTVTLGGESVMTDKFVGISSTNGNIILEEGATLSVQGFLSTVTSDNNGKLTVKAGATFTASGGEFRTNELVNYGSFTMGNMSTNRSRTNTLTTYDGSTTTFNSDLLGHTQGVHVGISTFNSEGGTTTFNGSTTITNVNAYGGTINFNADTTVSGTITLGKQGAANATINVGEDATLTAATVNGSWGYSRFNVDGVLNATTQFAIATAAVVRNIEGSGTINATKLVVGNQTTKAVFNDGLTLNIGSGGITGDGNGTRPLELHRVTVGVYSPDPANPIAGWTSSANNGIILADTATGTTFAPGAGQTITLNGVVSGSGKMLVTGGGKVVLNGNNTFSGGLTVTGADTTVATVEMGNNSALGNANNTITIGKGGVVDINGTYDVCYAYTLNGGSLLNNGTSIPDNKRQTMGLTLLADSYIGGSGNFDILNSNVTATTVSLGDHTLTKQDANRVRFYNTAVTGDGYLAVEAGTVEFASGGTFAANFRLAGGTPASGQTAAVTGTVNLAANTIIDTTAGASTFSAIITGNGKSVTKNGAGTLTLSGANTYTGGTTISAGTLKTSNASALGTGNVTVEAAGTLDVTGNLIIGGQTANQGGFLTNGGTLALENGAAVELFAGGSGRTYGLGNVSVNGVASIMNRWNDAVLNLNSIQGGTGDTLTLISNHCSATSTWNIGQGASVANFTGTLVLKAADTDGTSVRTRDVDFKFYNTNQFSGAAIQTKDGNFARGGTMNNDIVLAGDIKIGSLSDAAPDTTAAQRTVNWTVKSDSASERRTLVLDAESGTYSTKAKIAANVDIQKTGGSTQSFGGVDGFNGSIDVEAGELNIMNIAQSTSVSAQDVTISNATLGVYSGETATAETGSEGTLTVNGTLAASGNGTTLNANLELATGSTLDVSAYGGVGGLLMGSSVTLHEGMRLSDNVITSAAWTGMGFGDTYDLFSGVDSLNIALPANWLGPNAWVDASTYFENLEKDKYFLFYSGSDAPKNVATYVTTVNNGSNVGVVYIASLPEPTTGTLSLLALCALAARRRRK